MIPICILVILGYVTSDVVAHGANVHGSYRLGIVMVALPLLIFAARNYYVFGKMLKHLNNPILHNQILALILGVSILLVFTAMSIPSWANAFPIAHYGNLINAFILSYAVIRHHLVDIKLAIRRGTAWLSLAVIGAATYWLLLLVVHSIFSFKLDLIASLIATILALFVSIFVYQVRGQLFQLTSRAFRGSSYDYHQRLNEFTNKIHNVFSLKEQGGELLLLLVKAINVKKACLLFPEAGNGDYHTQFSEPKDEQNQLMDLTLRKNNPIVKFLEREQKHLTRDNLTILPAFLSLWPQEREEIESKNLSMFIPLISRDRLIAILVLGEKISGKYSLEDLNQPRGCQYGERISSRAA